MSLRHLCATALLLLLHILPTNAATADPQIILLPPQQQPENTAPLTPSKLLEAIFPPLLPSPFRSQHYESLGCWNETSGFATSSAAKLGQGRWTTSESMTPQLCFSFCHVRDETFEKAMRYAGLKDGRECHCTTTLPTSPLTTAPLEDTATASHCLLPCSGDATQTCGGVRALAVFDLLDSLLAITSKKTSEVHSVHVSAVKDTILKEQELQSGIAGSSFPSSSAIYGMLAAITFVIAAVV